ncbi:MAG TPA: phosphonate ABC transporter, permease protein PhnE [candidate division Zixibacteria bacterium]|nr:phosphonate ABC transporter, permease protein PhnE [candidate division Zixibacteria bacterium]
MSALAAGSRPARPSRAKRNLALLGAAVVVALCALTVDLDPGEILRLPVGVGLVFYEMFLREGPEWSYFPEALGYMLESLQIAWLGTVLGAIISLPLGFFGAKNVSSGLVSNVMRQVLNAIRAFPEVVLAIAIMIPIAGLGPVAGMLALGLHSVGTLGKLTAEVIEGIDPGPVEAARATGARPLQVQRWGVLPQVLPEIVAFWLYRFEINIRASAILGVVGAGGIGFVLQQAISFNRHERAGMIILVVIGATIVVDTISGWIRRRIIEGAEAKVSGELVEPELADVTA